MKELGKKFTRRMVLLALGVLAIGMIALLAYFKDYLPIGEEQNLDEITADQIHEGRARITVYYVYDYYCYFTDSSGKEVQRDYFVSMGPEGDKYIGVELRGKNNDRAYQLMNDIWDAEEAGEELDYDKLGWFTVKGNIQKITGEDLDYYNEYLDECAQAYDMSREEVEQYFTPYVLIARKAGARDEETDYTGIIIGGIFLVAGIALLFWGLFGDPVKEAKRFAKNTPNEEATMAHLERMINTIEPRYGIRADDEFFISESTFGLNLARTEDILWIYPYIVTHKTYFITTGKSYYVRLRLADGKMIQVASKKNDTDEIMNYCTRLMPDAIFGYSNELEQIYSRKREQMIAEVRRRREERLGSAYGYQIQDDTTADYTNDMMSENTPVYTDDLSQKDNDNTDSDTGINEDSDYAGSRYN